MPCYQSTTLPSGVTTTGRPSYATEADCLQACREGACCEGATCTVKPQCQCQGTGKVFKGVGTTCSPNPCLPCPCNSNSTYAFPVSATFTCEVDTVSPRSTTPWAANYIDAFRAAVAGFSTTASASYSPGVLTFNALQFLTFTSLSSPPCENQSVLNNLGKTSSTFRLSMNCNGSVQFNVRAYESVVSGLFLSKWTSPQQWGTYCQIGQAAYGAMEEFRVFSQNVALFNTSTTLPCDGPSSAIRTPWVSARGQLDYLNYNGAEFDASVRLVCALNYLP